MSMELGRRALLRGLGGLLVVPVLVSCGDDETVAPAEQPRALTQAEAERLAAVRLRWYQDSPVPVRMTWPGSPASTFDVRLDLREHRAWGTYALDGSTSASSAGLTTWDLQAVATAPAGDDGGVPGPGSWTRRALSTSVPHDVFLALALNLGSDRPENASLLRQSSARFLRRDEVAGREVMVLEGPQPASGETPAEGSGRTRYWLTDDADLLRFEAYLGQADGSFATVDLLDEVDLPAGLDARALEVLAAGS